MIVTLTSLYIRLTVYQTTYIYMPSIFPSSSPSIMTLSTASPTLEEYIHKTLEPYYLSEI